MEPSQPDNPDLDRLAAYLRALAWPSRLELLLHLREPRTVAEIPLRPACWNKAQRPDRPLAWQTVESHVRQLQRLGLVHARAAQRGGRFVKEYVLNPARVFLVVEELRALALPQSPAGSWKQSAPLAPERWAAEPGKAPALVLASGPLEGACFPLEGQGPWAIGRAKGLEVSLPYDPFVSWRNSEVRLGSQGLSVRSLPGARHGTRVNWRPLAEGEEAPLQAGDALGVGRSVLIVRGG